MNFIGCFSCHCAGCDEEVKFKANSREQAEQWMEETLNDYTFDWAVIRYNEYIKDVKDISFAEYCKTDSYKDFYNQCGYTLSEVDEFEPCEWDIDLTRDYEDN